MYFLYLVLRVLTIIFYIGPLRIKLKGRRSKVKKFVASKNGRPICDSQEYYKINDIIRCISNFRGDRSFMENEAHDAKR